MDDYQRLAERNRTGGGGGAKASPFFYAPSNSETRSQTVPQIADTDRNQMSASSIACRNLALVTGHLLP